jgi:hypothetical protein
LVNFTSQDHDHRGHRLSGRCPRRRRTLAALPATVVALLAAVVALLASVVALLAAAVVLGVPAVATAAPLPAQAQTARAGARPRAAPPTPAQELARITATSRKTVPGPTLAKGPLVWAAPIGIDGHGLDGLACPSISLCVAVDNDGRVLSSTDPSGGARRWQSDDVDASNSFTALSCPSASVCVAVDGVGNAAATGDPAGPASAWTVARVDSSITEPSPYGGGPGLLRGVSCPSVSFCVAVDSVGNAVYSSDPTGGAAAWGIAHIDNNSDYGCVGGGLTCQAPLMGVACPSLALCSAVDFTGNVLQTTASSVPSAWPSQAIGGAGPQSLWSVSCPANSFCATVDGVSGDVISWNPVTHSGLTKHRLPIDAFGIWCSSASLCLASGEGPSGVAELVGSTNPGAKSPAWNATDFGDINALSCPTQSTCLAADDEGEVIPGVTVKSLAAALRREAIGGVPKIGALVRRRGYALRFTSPLSGQLKIEWRIDNTMLANASAGFTSPRKQTVRLKLTGNGRALLKAARRISVTATATYQTNTGAVVSKRKLTLSSRG